MGFAWSHTTYAWYKDMIFNFEDRWDLDYFLTHAEGSKRISAVEAWKLHKELNKDFIRVFSSRCLGANKDRSQRIKDWKNEIRYRSIKGT